jgi:hypothetical protein
MGPRGRVTAVHERCAVRRILEATQDTMGVLLAWAIAWWAAHELWKAGYDDGYEAGRDELAARRTAETDAAAE